MSRTCFRSTSRRKTYLPTDRSQDGVHAALTLYGLIETAKANRIEPGRYLAHLFEVLPTATSPDQIEALLPQNLSPEALKTS